MTFRNKYRIVSLYTIVPIQEKLIITLYINSRNATASVVCILAKYAIISL